MMWSHWGLSVVITVTLCCCWRCLEATVCTDYRGIKSKDVLSVVYLGCQGQSLPEMVSSYAALRQIRQDLQLYAYMGRECQDALGQVLAPKSLQDVPVFQDKYCQGPEAVGLEPYSGPMDTFLTSTVLHRGRQIWLFPPKPAGTSSGYRATEHQGPVHSKFVEAYEEAMQRLLQFSPEISSGVEALFQAAADRLELPRKDVTFVGVHNRRKDPAAPQKGHKGGQKNFKRSYFLDAMDDMRSSYRNVVFFYVSNDMAWGRQLLLDNREGDLYLVGKGSSASPDEEGLTDSAFDLAILARCDHTIVTRGAFSRWAAVLAGGEYVTEYGSIVPNRVIDQIRQETSQQALPVQGPDYGGDSAPIPLMTTILNPSATKAGGTEGAEEEPCHGWWAHLTWMLSDWPFSLLSLQSYL